jgi:replicative DNA helicase
MTMFQPVLGSGDLERLVEEYRKGLDPEAIAYLESRCISDKSMAHFQLGYEGHKIGFTVAQNRYAGALAGRIVFPILDEKGTVLDLIGRSLDDREPKYKALVGTSPLLFHAPVLSDCEDVVLAGGLFDVLSLTQASVPAVCVPDCYSFHKDQAPLFAGKRVFVCYGNDDEGRRENERVAHLLEDVAEAVYVVTLPEGIKDINDLYVRAENSQDVFESLIDRAVHMQQASGLAPDSHYLTQYSEEYLKRHRGQTTGIPTGFLELDDLLLGGFRPGLCVISGPVGVGKTTLIRQMADHAAALGCPVVFFSWGASAFELWANSLSRLLDCSVRDILLGNVSPQEIKEANERYQEHAERMWTLEATMDTSIEDIAENIERIAQTLGKVPVIFLDWLQRIPVQSEKTGVLPTPERSALVAYGLHQIARELNCPLIVAATDEPRRSGSLLSEAVEAAADVWMRLTEGEGDQRVSMKLQVKKNRNGDTGEIALSFEDNPAIFKSHREFERIQGDDGADVTTA